MNDNQSPGYHSNRYRLGLNTGTYTGTTYTSDWAVAEVIVFDKTLNPKQYKCMENYLSVKYDICLTTYSPTSAPTPPTDSPTKNPTDAQCLSQQDLTLRSYECKSVDLTQDLYTQCLLTSDDIYAWYDGDSYSSLLNEWFDKSGNCRNVDNSYISGTITTYNDLNDKPYLTGTTTTTIDFPYDVLPSEYSLFHISRYFDGTEGRILQSYDYDWLSGFYSGTAGVAHHENWITPTGIDLHGREWVISSDQRSKYRSDGKTRTNNKQSVGYSNNRYRLTINNGYYSTQDSDWAIAEIIVIDKEINTQKIKCIEKYLSNKYDETIYNSNCNENDIDITNLVNQCEFNSDNLFAWYSGDSYDKSTNIWYDKSTNCRNVDSNYIDGTLDIQSNDLNNKNYVNGSTSSIIQFPFEILPNDYTFIHVTKYIEDGIHRRIFQSNDYDWFSGFNNGGYAGIAYHQNWITSSNTDYHGTGWVISTDQRSLYRSNGISRLTNSQSPSYANNRYELVINKGYQSSWTSDFGIAEILIFDEELSAKQYKCIESYLSDKYSITIAQPSQCLDNININNSFQTQCNNILNNSDLQPFAWYDGSSYNFADKLWMDKSGNCRNVESQHIEGNIFIKNDLNGEKYLEGTTSSRMEFPYEILPTTYTFIHVAKWVSSSTGRLFNALNDNWWSGFNEYHVMDVSAYHSNWITPVPGNTAANYIKDWIISTDQRNIYRANGVFKMNNDQDAGYRSNRYTLGLNTGLHPSGATAATKYGDWAVAEILVFDRELEPVEYKCIEEYLSDKYNIIVNTTECKQENDTITEQCELPESPYAHYSGSSFDSIENIWFDNSKYCRNIDNTFITNTINHITNDLYDEMNGEPYITGTTSTRINFPYELLPIDYTFFHVTRYYDGTEDIIFQSYDYSWISGFYQGYAGVSTHQNWITPSNTDIYGRQWCIINDQRSLFRTNGIGRTTDTQSVAYSTNQYRLAVNQGYFGTDDPSDFAIAEIIIFNYELTSKQYKCVESYLCQKYDKVCHESSVLNFQQIDIDNNNLILLTDKCPNINTSNIVAWYNGDSYDEDSNIWYDQSGYGRNIDSNYISGNIDIDIGDDLNNYKYINGSTFTTIDFPFDLLPLTYTFFHVAKYNGIKDRIFQSYDFSWTSGFTNGYAGTAFHQNWITSSNIDYHNNEWVLSTDQRNLYRSNGVNRMINDQEKGYQNNRYILTINNGINGGEDSDFAISEIIIFDIELSITEYRCIEEYLALKYNLCLPVPSINILPTEIPTINPTKIPTNGPSLDPTIKPSINPTIKPTNYPSINPTFKPSFDPTLEPTIEPTQTPTINTINPTNSPSIEPTYPTSSPTSAPFTPTYPTIEPTKIPTMEPTQIPSSSPTDNTNNPSIAPSTDSPTIAPAVGTCLDNGLIKNLYWNNISSSLPEYEFNINIDTRTDLLGINIEFITDYIGSSYDANNNEIGTSYIFDFTQFHSYNDKIEKPGSCSNRLSSSYSGKTFNEYWQFSPNPSDINGLGNIDYLAYGPLPSQWTLSAESQCTKVRYSGDLRWDELRNCVDFEGNKLMTIDTDNDWINMTGRFYLSIISPILMNIDIGYHIKDLIVSYPFTISISKSIHILNNIGINVFLVTIFQTRRTYNIDNSNDDGGYIIVLSSQTADYLQLINPMLLTYPLQYNTWTMSRYSFNNGLNGSCYINSDDICIQFWMIEINHLNCPISFDGIFDIEWTAKCNPNNNDDLECNSYLNSYGNQVALSINMQYTDSFNCDITNNTKIQYNGIMNFYTDSLFTSIDNNLIYRSDIDIIYVEIEIVDLSSILSAKLLNVWICGTTNNNDILQITRDHEMSSGCFDSLKIDSNTFNAIILNQIELLYNAQIYNTSSIANNIIRFSFTTPDFVGVDTIYIHSEIELILNDATITRRMLLSTNTDSSYNFDKFLHVMDGVKIDSQIDDKKKVKIRSWLYVLIALILMIVTMIIIFYLKYKRKKNNNLPQYAIYEANNNAKLMDDNIVEKTDENVTDGINETVPENDGNIIKDGDVETHDAATSDDDDGDMDIFKDNDDNEYINEVIHVIDGDMMTEDVV